MEPRWTRSSGNGRPGRGAKHAVAVSSGTAALHTALAALRIPRGPKSSPSPVTDIGTVIAIMQNNLVPVFADVDPETGMITPKSVLERITPRTAAVMPVHLFGRCTHGPALAAALAERHGIAMIEDASQAHFSTLDGRPAGTFGVVGCFSLQQTKVVSCGEGGILVTNDDGIATAAQLFQNKGWLRGQDSGRDYPVLGVNYRLSELSAAVALAQLGRAADNIERRRVTRDAAARGLQGIPGVQVAQPGPHERVSWWALACQFDDVRSKDEAAFVEAALAAEGCPFLRGYIGGAPIYMHPAVRGRAIGSPPALPWSLRGDTEWRYEEEDCPGAMKFLTRSFVRLWCERMTGPDVAALVAATAKVASLWRGAL